MAKGRQRKMKMKVRPLGLAGALLVLVLALCGCGSATSAGGEAQASLAKEATSPKRVYLAGPFFNDEEVKNIELAESVCKEKGLEYFSPMRNSVDSEPGTSEWAKKIFEVDKEEIGKADVVVAMYYGNNSDSGTAWECGYASAIGKPVVLVHTHRDSDSNLMMHCGATTNIYLDELADYDFTTMPVYEYKGKMI